MCACDLTSQYCTGGGHRVGSVLTSNLARFFSHHAWGSTLSTLVAFCRIFLQRTLSARFLLQQMHIFDARRGKPMCTSGAGFKALTYTFKS